MKLSEIKLLKEAGDEYIVYRVSSPKTDRVYYSYTNNPDVRKAFLAGANRSNEPDRGDVRMMLAVGDDVDSLRFKELEIFGDEIAAFAERNDLRAQDSQSITGPTNFPATIFQRVQAIDPERVKRWKLSGNINNASAREAMGGEYKNVAAYNFNDLKEVVKANPKIKQQLTHDLDKLLYPEFKAKYFPERT